MDIFELYNDGAAALLKSGAIGVFPTETVYGIGTSAFNETSVETIFTLKKRPAHKPFAVLLADIDMVADFGIQPASLEYAKRYWPGPNTVIIASSDPKWEYLQRGSGGLSFRVPQEPHFRAFLRKTGPLATTSANLSGGSPVTNPKEAFAVFGNSVAVYMDTSPWASGRASTVIDLKNSKPSIVRP